MANVVDYFNNYVDLSSKIYWLLYEGAPQVIWWFINPLSETSSEPIIAELFGNNSPIELMFGVGLVAVLLMGVIKFFTSMTPL